MFIEIVRVTGRLLYLFKSRLYGTINEMNDISVTVEADDVEKVEKGKEVTEEEGDISSEPAILIAEQYYEGDFMDQENGTNDVYGFSWCCQ